MSQDEKGVQDAPESLEMTETVVLTDEQRAAQKSRNKAIAWALVAFVFLVFVVSFFRFQQAFENMREADAARAAEEAQEVEADTSADPE
jgi:flagellar biosynthesis/type III secretory pathway M-ring protein FliF/YscJ